MMDAISDIVELHEAKGRIEDAEIKIHMDQKVMVLNKYTMRARRGNVPRKEIKEWNAEVERYMKRDRSLSKEVKEFVSLFHYLEKAKIKSGYIEKSETPDFILTRQGQKIGIEITKIYIGNDWVLDKLNDEIKAYRLRKKDLEGYMEYKKYHNKIQTYQVRGGLVIAPNRQDISVQDYIIELKNKIFTKVRKLTDDYMRFDQNVIFVEVVASDFVKEQFDIAQMNEELSYFITYIESNFENTVAKVVLKLGDLFVEYNLSERTYQVL